MKQTKRNRRALNAPQQWTPPLYLAIFDEYIRDIVRLVLLAPRREPLQVAMFGPLQPVGWTLRSNSTGVVLTPVSAAVVDDGVAIELDYGVLNPGEYNLFVEAWDPAFRGRQGEWIAPAFLNVTVA